MFEYEAEGQMIKYYVDGQDYDTEWHLIRYNGSRFAYDGDGKRVYEMVFEGFEADKPEETFYVGIYYEQKIAGKRVAVNLPDVVTDTYMSYFPIIHQEREKERVSYYYAEGERFAMKSGGNTYYLFSDHLGSTTTVVERGSGAKIDHQLYHPWGTTRYSNQSYREQMTDYGYTGQMQVDDIYYYNARWYDPAIGRFMQADTLVPSHQGTQGFDRYAYTNNNPMKYTDPSGHWFIKGWEEVQWQVQPYDENICYAISSTMAINIALGTDYSYHTILDNFPIQSPKIYPSNGQKFEGYGVPALLLKNKLSNVFSDELIIKQQTFSRNKLLELLEQDVPVVIQIALRATFKDGFGHDVVAVGYDEENGFWFYNPWGYLVSESQLFEQLKENTPAGSFDEMIMYSNGILRPGRMISFKRILPQDRIGTGRRRLIDPIQEAY